VPPAEISPRQPGTTFELWIDVYGLRLGEGVLAGRNSSQERWRDHIGRHLSWVRLTIRATTTLIHATPLRSRSRPAMQKP